MVDKKKIQLGQFFTKNEIWLRPQIIEFILGTKAQVAVDPYAGDGHLLEVAKGLGIKETKGLDIDPSLKWEINDGLVDIPATDNAIIITNPPYLTKYSASRKKMYDDVERYFSKTKYVDLYQIALEKCLLRYDNVVAIVPETIINSSFPKGRMSQITILEHNPFDDTDCPVCVICFDKRNKPLSEIKVYKNDDLIGDVGQFHAFRLTADKKLKVVFNSLDGNIALRAVDMQLITKRISFMPAEELKYDRASIKVSSRLITLIDIPAVRGKQNVEKLVKKSNEILAEYREKTQDTTLSPFKGNDRNGSRRRRLDYRTARAILEMAYNDIFTEKLL
jgi:hypothetical protein